jgi:hypothetical protein
MFLKRIVLCEVLVNSCREYVPFFPLYILVLSFLAYIATLAVAEGTIFVKEAWQRIIHTKRAPCQVANYLCFTFHSLWQLSTFFF